jgi:hypothetical protein
LLKDASWPPNSGHLGDEGRWRTFGSLAATPPAKSQGSSCAPATARIRRCAEESAAVLQLMIQRQDSPAAVRAWDEEWGSARVGVGGRIHFIHLTYELPRRRNQRRDHRIGRNYLTGQAVTAADVGRRFLSRLGLGERKCPTPDPASPCADRSASLPAKPAPLIRKAPRLPPA